MNGINWSILYSNGDIVKQIEDNGKYNLFNDVSKQNIIFFTIQNQHNNMSYSVNLQNGQFLINGSSINFTIENDFRHQSININDLSKNIFWYNDCEAIIGQSQPKLLKVYFGYKIPLNIQYVYGNLIEQKILASIDVETNKFSISQSKKIKIQQKIIQI